MIFDFSTLLTLDLFGAPLGRLLEACWLHRKFALADHRSSKPTKFELEGLYGNPLYEHFRVGMFEFVLDQLPSFIDI